MLEDQPESAEPAGHAGQLLDCVGYGSLVPRRHKSEVNIGRRDRPDRQFFETYGKLGEFSCDLWHDLQANKYACL
jgi:hypothetical protein